MRKIDRGVRGGPHGGRPADKEALLSYDCDCFVSSSPDLVLRPVTVCLVSAPEPIVCNVCACGPVLHAGRCVNKD